MYNKDELLNNYVWWKKTDTTEYPLWFNLYKILYIFQANLPWQKADFRGCMGQEVVGREFTEENEIIFEDNWYSYIGWITVSTDVMQVYMSA